MYFQYLNYTQKYKKKIIEQIIIDLKKLIYRDLYLNEIPELSNDYPNRIRISLYCSAPFSPRIKHIVEHPVFSRLAEEHQLTLIDTIYPTATHSRLEHSIGVFYNCCLYIRSLYNDPYNPIFKQLINVHEIKTLLLASLLHDLGQYPFAHSFEELGVFKSQLSHKKLTKAFLKNTSVDNNKYTLRKYLKSEWGIRLYEIKRLLSRAEIPDDKFSRNLKLDLLSSIIDGTIDIDKLDYYQRDTHNCNLSYGLMIDSPRLIRNLTVIIDKDRVSNNNTFAIGVYRRAQAAAETLAFTRYLLYQSVYWHHTARSFISMLKIVLKSLNDSVEDFIEKFKKFLSVSKESKRINSLQVLEFIKKCIKESNHKDQKNLKDLIDMVKNRNYYKRIFTIQYEDCLPSGAETFLAEFRRKKDRDKPSFQTTLRDEIITKFKNKYTKNKRAEIISNLQYIKTLERLEQKSSIICDYVKPKSEDQKLTIIPEPKYLYQKEKNIKKHDSEVHTQVYGRLINIVSKGRIFCHPEIRDTLMHVLTLKDIENCIKNAMNKFT